MSVWFGLGFVSVRVGVGLVVVGLHCVSARLGFRSVAVSVRFGFGSGRCRCRFGSVSVRVGADLVVDNIGSVSAQFGFGSGQYRLIFGTQYFSYSSIIFAGAGVVQTSGFTFRNSHIGAPNINNLNFRTPKIN